MKRKFTMTSVKQSTRTLNFFKLAACTVVVVALGASASASCGDSLIGMAAAAASVHNQSGSPSSPRQAGGAPQSDSPSKSSIVGLWQIRFVVGGQTIQEAYQAWNVGGTEIHNPNVDPRTGSVCLGVWKKVAPRGYKLSHNVYSYDTSGNFQGKIHLSETLTLGDDGNTHSGSFALEFYDPSGNFEFEVAGDVAAERVSVE
jgi:hypothetical protein